MADNIIDLIGSPAQPSEPIRSPRIMRLHSFFTITQSKRNLRALCLDPIGFYFNRRLGSCIRGQLYLRNCEICQILCNNRFQASIHGDQVRHVAANYVPMTKIGAISLNPHGSNLNEAWNISQPELFLVRLINYWTRLLSMIDRDIMWNNRTPPPPPPQVQSYASGFFGHQPSTFSYYATTTTIDLISRNENHMAASNFSYNPMMPNESRPTLPLFPEQALSFSIPPANEGNDNTNGFQMQAGANSTSMNGSVKGGLDLELKLG